MLEESNFDICQKQTANKSNKKTNKNKNKGSLRNSIQKIELKFQVANVEERKAQKAAIKGKLLNKSSDVYQEEEEGLTAGNTQPMKKQNACGSVKAFVESNTKRDACYPFGIY